MNGVKNATHRLKLTNMTKLYDVGQMALMFYIVSNVLFIMSIQEHLSLTL